METTKQILRATATLDFKNIRADFPMYGGEDKKPFIYLDWAATSQTPRQVLMAMDAYYGECRANVRRGLYRASAEATARYEGARSAVAKFIGAEASEIIFTKNATESLNLAAYSLSRTLRAGDEVALTAMEHHANLVPWQQLALRAGATVKFIPLTPDLGLDMAAAREMIGPATKIVSIIHGSNVLGTIAPVRELAGLAHVHGATVIVDAAQTVGHRPIDVKTMDADLVAFSGHKMLGPVGLGVLWGRSALLQKMEPFLFGGDMIREVSVGESTWNDAPWKFEAGTPNIAGAIGLAAACDYLDALDLKKVAMHERAMADLLITRLSTIPGVEMQGPSTEADRTGAVSFTVRGIHPHDLATILAEDGVCIRGGHHCAMPLMQTLGLQGTARASVGILTTEEDIDALCRGIEKAKMIFGV